MIEKSKIIRLVEEKLTGDQFLVDVSVSSTNVITVLIDSDSGITINQCVEVSRHIEGNLDREAEDFELSVYSAGLGLPFLVHRQYVKNQGKEIEVLTTTGLKYSGILLNVTDDGFDLEVTTKEKIEGQKKRELVTRVHHFGYEQVKEAKNIIKF